MTREWAGREPDAAEAALFAEAARVTARAYAPYSGYAVGAALVAESGRVYLGVNVENAAYPAGLCAERSALAAMVTSGERDLRTVAVASAAAGDCLPCGLCLQALAEFGDPVVVARAGEAVRAFRLSDLLTAPFAAGGETCRERAAEAGRSRSAPASDCDDGETGTSPDEEERR